MMTQDGFHGAFGVDTVADGVVADGIIVVVIVIGIVVVVVVIVPAGRRRRILLVLLSGVGCGGVGGFEGEEFGEHHDITILLMMVLCSLGGWEGLDRRGASMMLLCFEISS